jgi:hypothetical protein
VVDGRLCLSHEEQLRKAFQVSMDKGISEVDAYDSALIVHDGGISKQPSLNDGSPHKSRARATWGRLLEMQDSVLDMID